mmetsp:Transcript_31815/g.62244  ORF Transcript_31815/g.62244 Transcript_31815/m.62244 type:complete len:89 (-) Transcript_31815:33-299(-)
MAHACMCTRTCVLMRKTLHSRDAHSAGVSPGHQHKHMPTHVAILIGDTRTNYLEYMYIIIGDTHKKHLEHMDTIRREGLIRLYMCVWK